MTSKLTSFTVAIALAGAGLVFSAGPAHAQRGGHGFAHGGYHGGGFYRPYGYYPYGFYRPYPFIGVGFGFGLYAPYYGSYAYPLAPGVVYNPYAVGGVVPTAPPAGVATDPNAQQPPTQRPAPDNTGHLQLHVPANADVFIDGQKINQTGTTREIVTPPVTPGTRYTYRISVRYVDAQGKPVDDTRNITFQANDWFAIDFTRPAPAVAPPQPQQPPPPQPLPNQLR